LRGRGFSVGSRYDGEPGSELDNRNSTNSESNFIRLTGGDMENVRRAVISVSDKTGLVDFAGALSEMGVEILSTGGTAKALREAGIPVKDVSEHTGFPEMLDGRVKTLHPKIHGGLLARRDIPRHMEDIKKHEIEPIDMVVVNLYPFESTVAKPDATFEEAIENIDIGGPAMLRSAAKNFASVAVIVDPADYKRIVGEMKSHNGGISYETCRELARKVFGHTARYDGVIYEYLSKTAKR
jgi:phosphoribosylaminoimidazolecarboxamide formyltransferase/IMP cyclohydrolase